MAKLLVDKILRYDIDDKQEIMLLQKLYNILQESYLKEKHLEDLLDQTGDTFNRDNDFVGNLQKSFDDKMEADFLSDKRKSDVPKTNISEFLNFEVDVIKKFMCWIFEKQFGWTEQGPVDNEFRKRVNSSPCSYRQDLMMLFESFITWFENHEHLSYYLLLGYRYAIQSSSISPVVRKHIMYSIFRWLKKLSTKYIIVAAKCYEVLKDIILLTLTDVWSAIRKDAASRLSLILDLLMHEQLEDFFLSLVQICSQEKGLWQTAETWQATEGAIRGIDKVLTSCKWIATSSVSKEKTRSSPSVLIKLGRNNFDSLPSFMKDNLEPILFKLFAHPQLSIREVAGKTFSTFLNKSEYAYLIESFEKVVAYLGKYVKQDESSLKFMNAYGAEGFMNAVLFLIKNIPVVNLLCKWHQYWSIFSHYLIHPASTVRQTASHVFKYLVSKDQTSPFLVKLVLQSLCAGWNTNTHHLVQSTHSIEDTLQERQTVLGKRSNQDITETWEWREGRLFAYELILKFLITNHMYFTRSVQDNLPSRKVNFNNSIAEGQFYRASYRKRSSNLASHGLQKTTKLTKSFTLTNSQANTTEAAIKSLLAKNQADSLLTICRSETKEKGLFLTKSVSALTLSIVPEITQNELVSNQQFHTEQKIVRWLKDQKFCSLRSLLKQVLLQTIECLHDVRWELRRMSQQLLPVVCEVIFHYDYNILEELYNASFKCVNSLLYNGACMCLLTSMKFFVKLKKNDTRSPTKKKCLLPNVNNLEHYVFKIAEYITSCDYQETCLLSIQILLIYQLHFNIQYEQSIDKTICDYFLTVSNLNSISDSSTQQQFCKKTFIYLLCSTQQCLLEYCENAPVKYTIQLLPVLLKSVHLSHSSSLDIHCMLNCSEVILHKLSSDDIAATSSRQHYSKLSCIELCNIFQASDLEILHARQTFGIAYLLQSSMLHEFPVHQITQTVELQLSEIDSGIKLLPGDVRANVVEEVEGTNQVLLSDDLRSLTTSFDSVRITNSPSSSDTSSSVNTEDDYGEGTDWDWSSEDEAEKNGEPLRDLFASFISTLKEQQLQRPLNIS